MCPLITVVLNKRNEYILLCIYFGLEIMKNLLIALEPEKFENLCPTINKWTF